MELWLKYLPLQRRSMNFKVAHPQPEVGGLENKPQVALSNTMEIIIKNT